MREGLSAERARHASIEQILSERAYTADAVQKLFNVEREPNAERRPEDFAPLDCWPITPKCRKNTKAPSSSFCATNWNTWWWNRSIMRAREFRLLRDEMGGRATFFVDSLNKLNLQVPEADASLPMPAGVLGRLDRLVDFREPLGPAAKHFLTKLRTAYVVEIAQRWPSRWRNENPHSYFLTPEGTCYHGRMVSGGRRGRSRAAGTEARIAPARSGSDTPGARGERSNRRR